MKKLIEVNLYRGQYQLATQKVEISSAPALHEMRFDGNVGEEFRMEILSINAPDYPEPQANGWYACPSAKCGYMFYKDDGDWYLYNGVSRAGQQADWMTLCETEADCVGGKGLILVKNMMKVFIEEEKERLGDGRSELMRH